MKFALLATASLAAAICGSRLLAQDEPSCGCESGGCANGRCSRASVEMVAVDNPGGHCCATCGCTEGCCNRCGHMGPFVGAAVIAKRGFAASAIIRRTTATRLHSIAQSDALARRLLLHAVGCAGRLGHSAHGQKHTDYSWGVPSMRVSRNDHQFQRPFPGGSAVFGPGGGYGFLPTPYYPSDTNQFGVYYVRGPW